jgi:hypothetical protein
MRGALYEKQFHVDESCQILLIVELPRIGACKIEPQFRVPHGDCPRLQAHQTYVSIRQVNNVLAGLAGTASLEPWNSIQKKDSAIAAKPGKKALELSTLVTSRPQGRRSGKQPKY